MSAKAAKLTLKKTSEDETEVLVGSAFNERGRKHHRHSHHSDYHEARPAESNRPKQLEAEAATEAPVVSVPVADDMDEIDEIATEEASVNVYQDLLPEEAENVLAVEAEEVEPEETTVVVEAATDENESAESFVEKVEKAIEPIEVPVVPMRPPVKADAVDFNGRKMSVEDILTKSDGTIVYELSDVSDGTTAYAKADQLKLLDNEEEKARRADLLKELWDANSGYIKAIYSFSHLGDRWTDPRDMTINRHVDKKAAFEVQEAARMTDRTIYLLGFTVAFVAGVMEATKVRPGEHLFGSTAPIKPAREVVTPAPVQAPSQPELVAAPRPVEPRVRPSAVISQQPSGPMAISINALG